MTDLEKYLSEVKQRAEVATEVYDQYKESEYYETVEANYPMLGEYITDVPKLLEMLYWLLENTSGKLVASSTVRKELNKILRGDHEKP